jgi:hypothetical protein
VFVKFFVDNLNPRVYSGVACAGETTEHPWTFIELNHSDVVGQEIFKRWVIESLKGNETKYLARPGYKFPTDLVSPTSRTERCRRKKELCAREALRQTKCACVSRCPERFGIWRDNRAGTPRFFACDIAGRYLITHFVPS